MAANLVASLSTLTCRTSSSWPLSLLSSTSNSGNRSTSTRTTWTWSTSSLAAAKTTPNNSSWGMTPASCSPAPGSTIQRNTGSLGFKFSWALTRKWSSVRCTLSWKPFLQWPPISLFCRLSSQVLPSTLPSTELKVKLPLESSRTPLQKWDLPRWRKELITLKPTGKRIHKNSSKSLSLRRRTTAWKSKRPGLKSYRNKSKLLSVWVD